MDQDKIIERLNIVRNSLGLNITKFAEMSGISQGNMSAMLNNKRVIGDGILNKIAISFDIRKDWLLTGEGEMKYNMGKRTFKELDNEALNAMSGFFYKMGKLSPQAIEEYTDRLIIENNELREELNICKGKLDKQDEFIAHLLEIVNGGDDKDDKE